MQTLSMPTANEIPIHDFVSSNAVSKSRTTEYQAGKIQYHTSDRMPRWGVAPKKENKHHKDRPYNGFVPIQPVPRHLIDMLLAGNAIAKYYKWQDYKAKHSNRIRDAYRDTYRLYKQARGISSKRKLHVERPVPSASAEALLPPAAIYEVRMPNQSASSEDFMVAEELNLSHNLENLGLMAGCKKWPATGDWYCEAMILLMESEAAVFCCDVKYDDPNEAGFFYRDVCKDHMSYAPPALREAIRRGDFDNVSHAFVPAANGHCQHRKYTLADGSEHKVKPYAACFNCSDMALSLNPAVLRSCHREVYDSVYDLIQSWYHEVLGECHGALVDPDVVKRLEGTEHPVFGTRGPRGTVHLIQPLPVVYTFSQNVWIDSNDCTKTRVVKQVFGLALPPASLWGNRVARKPVPSAHRVPVGNQTQ